MNPCDSVFIYSADPNSFEYVADFVVMPGTVVYVDVDANDVHEALLIAKDKVLADDWEDFWKYNSKQEDAQG